MGYHYVKSFFGLDFIQFLLWYNELIVYDIRKFRTFFFNELLQSFVILRQIFVNISKHTNSEYFVVVFLTVSFGDPSPQLMVAVLESRRLIFTSPYLAVVIILGGRICAYPKCAVKTSNNAALKIFFFTDVLIFLG